MSTRSVGILILFVAVIGLVACGGPPSSEPQGQQPAAEQAAPVTEQARRAAIVDHMKDHFTQVSKVRDAVVMNNEAAAQEAANWIIEHQAIEGLPPGWPPHVENMRAAARDALHAEGVEQAGMAVGKMARVCGECHLATVPRMTAPGGATQPGVDETPASHMLRHQWAINQMWIGLIYFSEDAWRRGADGLAFAALKPEQLTRDSAASRDVANLAIAVHTLGGQGAAAEGWFARAEVYGKLLGTCIGCHQRLKTATRP